jgi:predicted enzyme related to lactoylglutathione lyase
MEKISANTNALNWFEIPVTDMDRAKKFYETILDINMMTQEMNGLAMTSFPFDPAMQSGKVSGALVHHQDGNIKPGADGPVIYLNANPAIQTVADKIEAAGGKVIMPKTLINEQVGYMAFFMDTEGNRMGLHAGN